MTWSRAPAIAGSARRDACILSEFGSFVAIVNRPETAGRWRLALVAAGSMTREAALLLFNSVHVTRKHNLPDQLRVRPSSDRNGIA